MNSLDLLKQLTELSHPLNQYNSYQDLKRLFFKLEMHELKESHRI